MHGPTTAKTELEDSKKTGARSTETAMARSNGEIGRARLNSSHITISYAVFCLKKKKKKHKKKKKKNNIKKKKKKMKKKKNK